MSEQQTYNGEFARTEDAGNGLTRCEWCKTMTGEHARGCPSSIVSEPMDVIRFLVRWAQKNSTLLLWTKESRDECRVALKEAQDGVDKANADLADLRERLVWWIVMQHTKDGIEDMVHAAQETRIRGGMDADDSFAIYDAALGEMLAINAFSDECIKHDPAVELLVHEWMGEGGVA